MSPILVVFPGVSIGDDSPLSQTLPGLARLSELGEVFLIDRFDPVHTPESVWLGLRPSEGQMAQGPLTVSWLNLDPPPRSTHFHLSLGSCDTGLISRLETPPTPEESLALKSALQRLTSKSLVPCFGEGENHALVWEDVGDLATVPFEQAIGNTPASRLPEGDGERPLRRLIDDSVNLLTELEFNRIRIDQEIAPLNLLWPWGEGRRAEVPNLALRRGGPASVIANDLRLRGLARLAGYRCAEAFDLRNGLNAKWAALCKQVRASSLPVLLYSSVFAELSAKERAEESAWLLHEIDRDLFQSLAGESLLDLTVLFPSKGGDQRGVGLRVKRGIEPNGLPCDRRLLEERLAPVHEAWRLCAATLTPGV